MRLYELFWLINSSKFGRKFLVCPKAVTDLKNSQYYPLETPIGKTQITISTSKLFQIFHTRFQILDSNITGMSEWIITGENMVCHYTTNILMVYEYINYLLLIC